MQTMTGLANLLKGSDLKHSKTESFIMGRHLSIKNDYRTRHVTTAARNYCRIYLIGKCKQNKVKHTCLYFYTL